MILNILLWSLEREILNYHVSRQNVYVLINCTRNIMENVAIIIFNDVNRYILSSISFNQNRQQFWFSNITLSTLKKRGGGAINLPLHSTRSEKELYCILWSYVASEVKLINWFNSYMDDNTFSSSLCNISAGVPKGCVLPFKYILSKRRNATCVTSFYIKK